MEKIKIAFYGDDPEKPTGFGKVNHYILKTVMESKQFEIKGFWAINRKQQQWEVDDYPFPVFPCFKGWDQDPYARRDFLDWLVYADIDILYILNDIFILLQNVPGHANTLLGAISRLQKLKGFRIVFYFPVDSTPMRHWAEAIPYIDFPVTYTEFGRNKYFEILPQLKNKVHQLRIIPHGCDFNIYHPVPEWQVKEFMARNGTEKALWNKFVVTTVARNSKRKDISRTLLAFAKFQTMRKDAEVYFHTLYWGDLDGFDLRLVGEQIFTNTEIPRGDKTFYFPHPDAFNKKGGVSEEDMNCIYNMSSVLISTALGEGWGLPITEAFATKTPVIAPDNTSHRELVGKERGILVPCGETLSDWIVLPNDNSVMRPLANVDKIVEALCHLYDNPEELKKMGEAAYEWVQNYSWGKIGEQWVKLFEEAYKAKCIWEDPYQRRALERTSTKTGRPKRAVRPQQPLSKVKINVKDFKGKKDGGKAKELQKAK